MLRKDKKRKNRGWVPFGYKYLGPGNDLHSGKPTTIGDKAAQKHDWKYHELEQRGIKPKFVYSEADDDFIKEVGTQHASEWIAKNIFKAKKRLAESGWITDIRPQQRSKRETTLNDYKQFITPETSKRKRQETISPGHNIKARRTLALSKLTQEETMAGDGNNNGSGLDAGLSETPVDHVTQVYRGPPDHTFASLPFYDQFLVSRDMVMHDFAFRPTSVYDCRVDLNGSVDLNPGAGTSTHYITLPSSSTDATQQKARWFDYYASMYKYYHVIACKYEFYVENLTSEDLWVHLLPVNDVYPPVNATNVDMLQWSDCDSRPLSARAINVTTFGTVEQEHLAQNTEMDETSGTAGATVNFENGNIIPNTIGSNATVFRGTYRTGDYTRQIRLDANVENWTQVTTNPTLVERLLLRIKTHWDSDITASDGSSRNRNIRCLVRTNLEYLVEFKELKDGLKYPVNDQPMVVTISQSS
jgi:Phospholipase A2-like domain